MSKKIVIDTRKENEKIRFCDGNILFVDNNGISHVFGNKKTLNVSACAKIVKNPSCGNVRRRNSYIENKSKNAAGFLGVFEYGFIGDDGRKYNPDGTPFADNNDGLYVELELDGEDVILLTTPDGELHSCLEEDYTDDMTYSNFDDEHIPDEISGQKIIGLYHIECDDYECALALDENGDLYQIGEAPLCVDEFFRAADNISVICIDSEDDGNYCCVGLNEKGRLKLWTGDCDEDEEYRDFFNTIRYITDVVDFDICGNIGAAVNSQGKIQLWGDPELIKSYEHLIPNEFLAF